MTKEQRAAFIASSYHAGALEVFDALFPELRIELATQLAAQTARIEALEARVIEWLDQLSPKS